MHLKHPQHGPHTVGGLGAQWRRGMAVLDRFAFEMELEIHGWIGRAAARRRRAKRGETRRNLHPSLSAWGIHFPAGRDCSLVVKLSLKPTT
jgi:hypothetical protein